MIQKQPLCSSDINSISDFSFEEQFDDLQRLKKAFLLSQGLYRFGRISRMQQQSSPSLADTISQFTGRTEVLKDSVVRQAVLLE